MDPFTKLTVLLLRDGVSPEAYDMIQYIAVDYLPNPSIRGFDRVVEKSKEYVRFPPGDLVYVSWKINCITECNYLPNLIWVPDRIGNKSEEIKKYLNEYDNYHDIKEWKFCNFS